MYIKFYIVLSIIFTASQTLTADVIILKDGTVFIGEIKTATSKGIVFDSMGTTKTFNQQSIQKNTSDIKDIQNIPVEVTMKNGSVIKGYIQDFKKDSGLNLKTDYGPLTMPANGIISIQISGQKKNYTGPRAVVGIIAGCYFPVGPFKDRFEIQPNISAFAEINSVFARGLFFGIDAGYLFMKYRHDNDLRFDGGSFRVYAQYRFLDLRVLPSPARFLSPFIAAGAGILYVARRDNRDYTFGLTRKNEINALYTAAAGLDIFATESIIVRIQGGWLGVQQKNSLMNAFSTCAGIMWGF